MFNVAKSKMAEFKMAAQVISDRISAYVNCSVNLGGLHRSNVQL